MVKAGPKPMQICLQEPIFIEREEIDEMDLSAEGISGKQALQFGLFIRPIDRSNNPRLPRIRTKHLGLQRLRYLDHYPLFSDAVGAYENQTLPLLSRAFFGVALELRIVNKERARRGGKV
jgi:hypothetical protein